MNPVFIPSKGRHATAKTNIPGATWVVEPHEAKSYSQRGNVVVLPESNRGICYVRNFIKTHALLSGFRYFWMIDDDITKTGVVHDGRCVTGDITETLTAAEAQLSGCQLGALNYRQFAWACDRRIIRNKSCQVAVMMDAEFCAPLRYRVEFKDDVDMSLQVIASGGSTAITGGIWFDCPTLGKNSGGLFDGYQLRRDEDAARKMLKLWPGIVKLEDKRGRVDCKINWKMVEKLYAKPRP